VNHVHLGPLGNHGSVNRGGDVNLGPLGEPRKCELRG
jgi:hypothetical protein